MSEKEEKETETLEAPISLDEAISARLDGMTAAEKDLQLRIMFLLNQSEKFLQFVEENFDIQCGANEETKTIDLVVIEKPVAEKIDYRVDGYTLDVPAQLKATMILKHNGCTRTAETLKSLIKIITGEDIDKPKLVTSATKADVEKELDIQKNSKIILD